MRSARRTSTPDRVSGSGTMVVVLLLAALVPAGCVLWFLNAAMQNQKLAVRQHLTDVYRSQTDARIEGLTTVWDGIDQALKDSQAQDDVRAVYQRLVGSTMCSGLVVYDKSGQVVYPRQSRPVMVEQAFPELWAKARQLEEDGNDVDAAEVYGGLVTPSANIHLAARAMQSQIRCLVRASRNGDAIKIILGQLSNPNYRDACDADGRLIVPSAQLLALEVGGSSLTPEHSCQLIRLLILRLWDENDMAMPSAQRLFLIEALRKLKPGAGSLPSDSDAIIRAYRRDAAQNHAERYLSVVHDAAPHALSPAGIDGLWAMASPNGRIVVLFSKTRLEEILQEVSDSLPTIRGADVVIRHNSSGTAVPKAFLREPVGASMPGWHLSLFLKRPDPFLAAASQQRVLYLIIAAVAISMIVALAVGMARYFNRQMKLTRLKNDLIATVSHELKTPLASMRVLVDTLIDGRLDDQAQADDYLHLIARENLRLSRLIDNFLTFSRMERNKCAFSTSELQMTDLVSDAVESAGERFTGEPRCLEVNVVGDLPLVEGDHDALVTVILNLLDNAWKYSGEDRQICLKAFSCGGLACIEVSDNGIGMSPRIVSRIFGRFYQADIALTRTSGGCGLGLSIVKFILDAHGGSIDVVSRPDAGSTFTVTLPTLSSKNAQE